MADPRVLTPVHATWLDSSGGGHWTLLSEFETWEPTLIQTMGYLLRETDDYVIIVMSYDSQPFDEQRGDTALVIPRFAILNMELF